MRKFIGLLLLAAAVVAVIYYSRNHKPGVAKTDTTDTAAVSTRTDLITVKGPVGGEKVGFLDDPAVKKILADRYGLKVDYEKRGSIEMVNDDVSSKDFLWPSSTFAAEVFRKRQIAGGKADPKSETIFNSPLVFYSWDIVTNALVQQRVVEKRGDTYYLTDAASFVKMISAGKKWKEIGLQQLYGHVTVYSTDPTRSNSGTMFAGLLATLLNDGEVVDDTSVDKVLPQLKQFFSKMGYMEGSSGDLFKQFLNTGVGANPIIAAYENQMIEYSLEHPEQLPLLQQSVRVIYPQPTMWSSHPLIALSENGGKLAAALKDQELQRIAWERHGFRSGLLGVQNDTKTLKVVGVPPRVESVVPMPSASVMQKILDALKP